MNCTFYHSILDAEINVFYLFTLYTKYLLLMFNLVIYKFSRSILFTLKSIFAFANIILMPFQNGDTPLHIAVALNRHHIVRLLLDNGASAFIRNMVINKYIPF